MSEKQFKPYGIEYSFGDGMYCLTVLATSPDDAMERVRAAAGRGRCYTPHGIAIQGRIPFGRFLSRLFWHQP